VVFGHVFGPREGKEVEARRVSLLGEAASSATRWWTL
jgi:hypothetical protein